MNENTIIDVLNLVHLHIRNAIRSYSEYIVASKRLKCQERIRHIGKKLLRSDFLRFPEGYKGYEDLERLRRSLLF